LAKASFFAENVHPSAYENMGLCDLLRSQPLENQAPVAGRNHAFLGKSGRHRDKEGCLCRDGPPLANAPHISHGYGLSANPELLVTVSITSGILSAPSVAISFLERGDIHVALETNLFA